MLTALMVELEKEIAATEQRLSALHALRNYYNGSTDHEDPRQDIQAAEREVSEGQFAGKWVGDCIRECLAIVKRPTTVARLQQYLLAGSCDLGTKPAKNIRLAVRNNSRFLAHDGDYVRLVSWKK